MPDLLPRNRCDRASVSGLLPPSAWVRHACAASRQTQTWRHTDKRTKQVATRHHRDGNNVQPHRPAHNDRYRHTSTLTETTMTTDSTAQLRGGQSASAGSSSLPVRLYNCMAKEQWDSPLLLSLLVLESVLCVVIVRLVSYTEIDWEAYMEEVEAYLGGEYDYRKIRGGTGPLVYPAGFLYLFAGLRWLTNQGQDIPTAQLLFSVFYVMTMAVVLSLYQTLLQRIRTKQSTTTSTNPLSTSSSHVVWCVRVAMMLCCLSKRLHSIYVLRLFNDGTAMLLLYGSVWFFVRNQWKVGCFVFSLAVSIKMNVLLFAPGLLLLLLQANPSLMGTFWCLFICGITQLVLGAPFLLRHPLSYLRKAFELDRVFFYKWTVNWKVRLCD